jgi:hypothetical protein
VNRVVLDTDVASLSFKRQLPPGLLAELIGREPAVAFVTAGELTKCSVGSGERFASGGWTSGSAVSQCFTVPMTSRLFGERSRLRPSNAGVPGRRTTPGWVAWTRGRHGPRLSPRNSHSTSWHSTYWACRAIAEPYGTQQRQVDAGRQRAIFPIVGSGAVRATLDQFVVNLRGYSSMAPPTARRWSRKLKEGPSRAL